MVIINNRIQIKKAGLKKAKTKQLLLLSWYDYHHTKKGLFFKNNYIMHSITKNQSIVYHGELKNEGI